MTLKHVRFPLFFVALMCSSNAFSQTFEPYDKHQKSPVKYPSIKIMVTNGHVSNAEQAIEKIFIGSGGMVTSGPGKITSKDHPRLPEMTLLFVTVESCSSVKFSNEELKFYLKNNGVEALIGDCKVY